MIKLIRKLLRLNKVPKKASREDLISSLYKSNTVDATLGINYIRGSWLPPMPDKDVDELKGELSAWVLSCCEAFLDTDYIRNPHMIRGFHISAGGVITLTGHFHCATQGVG